jgi:CheY-like chemotaxis protein
MAGPNRSLSSPDASAMNPEAATILVVEDDTDVREVAVLCLADAGYRVLTAATGELALPIIASGESIDLLFSDIVMPGGVNGFALARQAVALRPTLKVLLTTGYADQIAAHESMVARGELLAKPYRLGDLVARVAERLGAGAVQLNRVLFRLLAYWRAKCAGRPCPEMADIDLAALADIGNYLSIIRVQGTPPDLMLSYRLVSPELRTIFGVDLSGRMVGESSPAAHRAFITGLLRDAVVKQLPVYSATGFSYADGSAPAALAGLSTERLFLPLAAPDGHISDCLCGQTFDWTSGGATVTQVLQRTIGRKDTVDRLG